MQQMAPCIGGAIFWCQTTLLLFIERDYFKIFDSLGGSFQAKERLLGVEKPFLGAKGLSLNYFWYSIKYVLGAINGSSYP